MLKLFKKKEIDEHVYAPVNGTCISLDDVQDEVFSSRMMGDGVAFHLSDDSVYAPFNGEIVMIASTKHAIGLKGDNGIEILIHVGMDTVNLNGEGFTVFKKSGDRVEKGEAILKIDKTFMQERNIDLTTPMIVTNGSEVEIEIYKVDTVVKAETILITKKA